MLSTDMLNATHKSFVLTVIMLNAVMLSVVAPFSSKKKYFSVTSQLLRTTQNKNCHFNQLFAFHYLSNSFSILVLRANLKAKHKRCDSEKFISNNDNPGRSAMGLYIQQKEGGRELDSGETARESVCER
jgi:hypothetical protein